MTRKPGDTGGEPPGGRAAERLREFERQHGIEPDDEGEGEAPGAPPSSRPGAAVPPKRKSPTKQQQQQQRPKGTGGH